MKTPQHLEYRVLAALEALGQGQSLSQADVFCTPFPSWPTPGRGTARMLAACANAARGRDLLWLIGVAGAGRDMKAGSPVRIKGAVLPRFDEWLGTILPWFEGLAPGIRAFAVPVGASGQAPAKQIVALQIETNRAPFVIRQMGKDGALDIPWWEADRGKIRSAGRAELIKLLVPLQALPQVDVLEAELTFYKNPHSANAPKPIHRWTLDGSLYIIPQGEARTVVPLHRCRGGINLPGGSFAASASEFNLSTDKQSPAIRITDSAALIEGLGRVFVYFSGATASPEIPWRSALAVTVDLLPAGSDRAAVAMATLQPVPATESNQAGRWKL